MKTATATAAPAKKKKTCGKPYSRRGPCLPTCDRARCAVLRRLIQSIADALDAAYAAAALPEPEGLYDEDARDENGVNNDAMSYESIEEDVAGLIWVLKATFSCIEGCTLSCCWSEQTLTDLVRCHEAAKVGPPGSR